MNRLPHLAVAFAAFALHVAAPLGAYSMPAMAGPGETLCSVAGMARAAPFAPSRAPLPATDPQHCAQSTCCLGSGTSAAAPPLASIPMWRVEMFVWRVAVAADAPPRAVVRLAAQPRAPPRFS